MCVEIVCEMLVVLSPAKTLVTSPPPQHLRSVFGLSHANSTSQTQKMKQETVDHGDESSHHQYQQPRLIKKAHALVQMMSSLSLAQLKSVLSVSDQLANVNYNRYKHFMDQEALYSIMAFDGQVRLDVPRNLPVQID